MSVVSSSISEYTPQLRQLMLKVGIKSFADLSRKTGLSQTRIGWVRQGRIEDLCLGQVWHLSQTLEVTLEDLFVTFSSVFSDVLLRESHQDCGEGRPSVNSRTSPESTPQYIHLQQTLDALKTEYNRQQQQFQNQQVSLWQEYQKSTVQVLESLLLQWPTAAYAAHQNPAVSAVKILPLLRPLEQLLTSWNIVPIGEVGTEISYTPQWHQLMSGESELAIGERVRVRYVGYRQGEQLLYRAKVSPI